MENTSILLLEELPKEDGYYVYLLYCKNHSLYCGWTKNIKKRLLEHQKGKGAK